LILINGLGMVYAAVGRIAEAQQLYEDVIATEERAVASHNENVELSVLAAGACCNLANLLREKGAPAEALDCYGRAMGKLNAVLQRMPNHAQARQFLCNAHIGRAYALGNLRRFGDSIPDWDQVLKLNANSRMEAGIRVNRAFALAQAGEHAEA